MDSSCKWFVQWVSNKMFKLYSHHNGVHDSIFVLFGVNWVVKTQKFEIRHHQNICLFDRASLVKCMIKPSARLCLLHDVLDSMYYETFPEKHTVQTIVSHVALW